MDEEMLQRARDAESTLNRIIDAEVVTEEEVAVAAEVIPCLPMFLSVDGELRMQITQATSAIELTGAVRSALKSMVRNSFALCYRI